MIENKDHFEVLRKIKSNPNSSQRELAGQLGFSLGKLNYCLKALKDKGLIKIKNFNKNPNRVYNNLLSQASPDDLIIITGSNYIAKEIFYEK